MKTRSRVPVTKSVREWIEGDFRTLEVMGAAMVIAGSLWVWLGLQITVLHYQRGVFAGSYADALSFHLPVVEVGESLPGLFFIGSVGLAIWALLTCHALTRFSKHWWRGMMWVAVSSVLNVGASWTVYRSGDYLFGMAVWQLEAMHTIPEPSQHLTEEIEFGERILEAYSVSRGR